MAFEGTHAFFSAGKGMQEYPFEIAAEYDFKCPETGKPLKAMDNKRRVKELKKRITTMKTEIDALQKNKIKTQILGHIYIGCPKQDKGFFLPKKRLKQS